jgi:hypothetical protein
MGATSYMPDHDELRKRLEKYLGGPVRAGEGAPKTGPPRMNTKILFIL